MPGNFIPGFFLDGKFPGIREISGYPGIRENIL
jgi:hypothetical protein